MTVIVAAVDLDRLARRYQSLQMRYSALQGRARELQGQQTRLTRDISLAKARIELAPQATEVFNYLQEQAHARAVGEFEDLLSAFVSDVVPDAGKIRLELGTERGAPALDILLDNGGDLENILEGNGGGLTNVVVTGLGFSSLARTANRQLMVLDEPDCWLKAKYVPNFTKVIAEVANPRTDADGVPTAGCQTLMISHNDISLMDEGAHIQDLRIERDLTAFAARLGVPLTYKGEVGECAYVVWVPGGKAGTGQLEVRYREDGLGDDEQNALTKGFPYVEAIGGARPWEADLPGVRWVEVINLRRHVFSRMELSPGLNVLTGDINGGKSTMYFTALRAMAYGETDDTMIRHGADSAIVRLGLENDIVLEMVRSRKGSPKVLFRRYERGVLTNEGRQETRGGVPGFISATLKIARVDDLDIQLRSQKQPVFLLDETPARRAQLLSVGRESGLLQALIERQRLQNRRDKDQVRRDEVELNQVSRTLTALAPVGAMTALVEVLTGMLDEARNAKGVLDTTRALVARLNPLVAQVQLLSAVGSQLTETPQSPVWKDAKPLAEVVTRLARNQLLAQVPDMPNAPSSPSVPPTAKVSAWIATIAKGNQAERLAALMREAPVLAPLADTAPVLRNGVALKTKRESVTVLEKEDKAALTEASAADEALHTLKHQLGVCPTCSQTFPEKTHD